jgi:PAS domain S-box-containing protein
MPLPVNFEGLLDHSPNPYVLLDRGLTIVWTNRAYLRVTGRTAEDIRGRNLFEAFPGDPNDPDQRSVRELQASFDRVLLERKPDVLALIHYAIPRQTPEGTVFDDRYWSATHTPVLGEHGEVTHILQHTVDVTELQHLKKALSAAEAASEAGLPLAQVEEGVFRRAQVLQQANRTLEAEGRQLRRLFDQAPGFMAVLGGPEHVFLMANAAYTQLVGHREVVGKPVAEALPEVVGQGFLDLLGQVYASGVPFVGRGVGVHLRREPDAEPEEVFVDFVYQPVIEPDGSTAGIFVQGHDVTEQHRAQQELLDLNYTLEERVARRTEELEARNRELQEFAYVVTHDLREPLRKVQTFADFIVTRYGGALGEDGRAYLARIPAATHRMADLIEDLLDYFRVSTRERDAVPVDLAQLALEVVHDLQARIEETEARVEIGALPTVAGDAVMLRQLLQNLVGNALKFHRPGIPPEVIVDAQVEGEGPLRMLHLEVRDNGIGFAPEHADRIFAPFQRLHSREEYEGTGIGLTICRRVAERSGGTITAESTPDVGTTFTVRLPLLSNGRAA